MTRVVAVPGEPSPEKIRAILRILLDELKREETAPPETLCREDKDGTGTAKKEDEP